LPKQYKANLEELNKVRYNFIIINIQNSLDKFLVEIDWAKNL
jgi:hypothetical protein